MGKPSARTEVNSFVETRQALQTINRWLSTVKFSTDNVTDPPTDAEIDAAFGTPATVGSGFLGVIDDNAGGGSGDVWACFSNGSAWFYVGLTKAV